MPNNSDDGPEGKRIMLGWLTRRRGGSHEKDSGRNPAAAPGGSTVGRTLDIVMHNLDNRFGSDPAVDRGRAGSALPDGDTAGL